MFNSVQNSFFADVEGFPNSVKQSSPLFMCAPFTAGTVKTCKTINFILHPELFTFNAKNKVSQAKIRAEYCVANSFCFG
jgi:hypothetical protein